MTKQEQIEEMAKLLRVKEGIYREEIHPCKEDMHCEKCCCLYKSEAEALYDAGYRKINDFEECRKCPAWSGTDCTRNPYTEGCLDDKVNLKNEIKRLKKENEQLKAKLEKNPLAIKQKIMEEDDYELTEREQATLFLDRMGSDVEILHDIVENLDELLGKGIDGVEGLKDMWERSAVREFADKVKAKPEMFLVAKGDGVYGEKPYVSIEQIDELLKELVK